MLRKVFARLDSIADVPVQFVFEEIYVFSEHGQRQVGNRTEDNADIFRFVQGTIYRTASETRSDWSFEIKDISNTDRQHLSFALSSKDTLEITLRTGGQPLPCDLAAVFYVPFKSFSGGTFQGDFALSTRNGQNSPTIRLNNVIFRNVPLAPLVGTYTDFAVAGTIADLRFTQAVFGDDIFVEGCLQVLNGAVEKALFHRCVGNFRLNITSEDILDLPMRMIPFTACVVHFRLQPEGIDFWADEKWDKEFKNSFMYHGTDVIADWVVSLPSHRRTVTYHELMSIFAADDAPVVPLTPGTQSLLPHVPIP